MTQVPPPKKIKNEKEVKNKGEEKTEKKDYCSQQSKGFKTPKLSWPLGPNDSGAFG